MKVKSESEVAQSCLTLSDPMDCSLPASSIHGIFQARALEWGAIAFSVFSPTHYIKYISTYPSEINSSITSKATIIEVNQEKIYNNNKINNNKK